MTAINEIWKKIEEMSTHDTFQEFAENHLAPHLKPLSYEQLLDLQKGLRSSIHTMFTFNFDAMSYSYISDARESVDKYQCWGLAVEIESCRPGKQLLYWSWIEANVFIPCIKK